jgi:hypothetical protein
MAGVPNVTSNVAPYGDVRASFLHSLRIEQVLPYDEDTDPHLRDGATIDVYPGTIFEVDIYGVDMFGQRLLGKHAIITVTVEHIYDTEVILSIAT